jgi:hypothetical protein
VAILPVALSYDRIPEERAFAAELAGAPKPKMRLSALANWTAKVARGKVHLGRAHIACGAPVLLTSASDVPTVAEALMQELRDATVATTYHLEAYLGRHPAAGWDAASLRQAVEDQGGRVLESPLKPSDDLDPRIATTLQHQFIHRFPGGVLPQVRSGGASAPAIMETVVVRVP